MPRFNYKSGFLTCFVVIFATSLICLAAEIAVISKDQLREKFTRPGVIVIDVRVPHDWDSSDWKIQGAQRQLPSETKEWMGKYPKDKTIVLYCA